MLFFSCMHNVPNIFLKDKLPVLFVHCQSLKSGILSIFWQIYSKYVLLFRVETPAYFIAIDCRFNTDVHP